MKRMRARAKARQDRGEPRKPGDDLRVIELVSEMEDEFRRATDIKDFAKVPKIRRHTSSGAAADVQCCRCSRMFSKSLLCSTV